MTKDSDMRLKTFAQPLWGGKCGEMRRGKRSRRCYSDVDDELVGFASWNFCLLTYGVHCHLPLIASKGSSSAKLNEMLDSKEFRLLLCPFFIPAYY